MDELIGTAGDGSKAVQILQMTRERERERERERNKDTEKKRDEN